MEDRVMSRIDGYSVYQSSFYENVTKIKKAKETDKEDKIFHFQQQTHSKKQKNTYSLL